MAEDFKLYKVIDVVKRTDITKAGDIVDNYEIYFETKSGIKSSIIVPASMNEKEVQERLEKEAEKLEKIFSLKK